MSAPIPRDPWGAWALVLVLVLLVGVLLGAADDARRSTDCICKESK